MQLPLLRRARRGLALSATIVLALALGSRTSAAQAPVDAVVAGCSPALVHVDVRFASPDDAGESIRVERPSSGILIDSAGMVLTAAHLVAEVEDGARDGKFWLEVHASDDQRYRAHVIRRDERTDLALLQLELPEGTELPAVPLGGPTHPAPGSRVVAISAHDDEHAYAFQGAAIHAAGPIKLRHTLLTPDDAWITDARFHQLLDGAPLLDAHGTLVGIYNSSHVRAAARDRDEDPEDLPPDYAVIVSSAAVHASFADLLTDLEPSLSPPNGEDADRAVEAVSALEHAVVSVWVGPAEDFPNDAQPDDPHGQRAPAGLGSGVVVDGSGLVFTSAHLFQRRRDQDVIVRLANGKTFSAELVARRKQLALLRLQVPEGTDLPVARIGDSAAAKSGEFVVTIGRPFAASNTLSVGVLGNLARGTGFFQIASWLHAGHWGGALADTNGQLLGICVRSATGERKVDEESYLGFAAPIERALEWFDKEWAELASVPLDVALEPDRPEALRARESDVTRVVQATQSSLINITVAEAVASDDDAGFDPFSTGEKIFMPVSSGSGVIIDESGLALSNWHVVDAAVDRSGEQQDDYQITVTLPDGRHFVARVLSTSRDDDLSLLKLELADGEQVRPVELADSDELVLGQGVVAIGNALSLSDSVSFGAISCLSSDEGIKGRLRKYEGMLTTDAAINPGNSGGALLDLKGRLVGINSAGTVGLGLSIPVNRAREVFNDKLLSAKRLRSAYLGVLVSERDGRMIVDEVDPVGPAARAGAELDDVIVSLDGKPASDAIAWAEIMLHAKADQQVQFVVEREGTLRALELTPLSFTAWRARQFCGVEVAAVDYDVEYQLVRAASIELHRAFTELPDSEPSVLMTGALRVVQAASIDGQADLRVRTGDLLLGITRLIYDTTTPRRELVRFETIDGMLQALTPYATLEGSEVECWLWRDGKVVTERLPVKWKR